MPDSRKPLLYGADGKPLPITESRKEPRQRNDSRPNGTGWPIKWILGSATLIGGIVAALTFIPRVSISPSDPADPSNPFSATFTVINSTPLPITIYHVDARIVIDGVVTEPLAFHPPKTFIVGPGGWSFPAWQNHTLRADEHFTISPEMLFGLAGGAKLSGADIAVAVRYQPWYMPWKREAVFRFVTQHHQNGTVTWYSVPLD
jgi:hypothetical protein